MGNIKSFKQGSSTIIFELDKGHLVAMVLSGGRVDKRASKEVVVTAQGGMENKIFNEGKCG